MTITPLRVVTPAELGLTGAAAAGTGHAVSGFAGSRLGRPEPVLQPAPVPHFDDGGFVGKFYAFSAAYDRGWIWLMIVGIAATLVSLYYYLGVVRAMYFRSPVELQLMPAGGSPPREATLQVGVALALVVTVGSFFAVQPMIDIARHAAQTLAF